MKVFVVGGGVIGLSCAWQLAQRGAAVTLFEAGSPGNGASGAALGALWPASPLAKHPIQNLQRQSLWKFEKFVRELSDDANHPIPFARLGRIELLNSPKLAVRAAEEAAVAQSEWPDLAPGYPIMEAMSKETVEALFPTLATGHHGAVLCRATAQVHIPHLLHALESACRKARVELRCNTPVTNLSNIDADAVLIAAGAWTRKLDETLPVIPAKGQGIALAPPAHLHLRHIVKQGATYLIPWHDEILVGSTTEPEAGFDEAPTEEACHSLHQRATAMFPELAEAKILRHWAGLRPDAPNHQPIMGKLPDHKNIYVAAGHYKTGVALAPLVGQLMTTLILDGTTPPELVPFLPA